LWTYINPRGDSTLTINGTNAVIAVPGGINHELWTNVTTAPRLMQAVGNVNFQVEAKFDAGLVFPTHGTQEEGIMVQQDSQTFIRFALFTSSNTWTLFVATFAAGQPTGVTYITIPLASGQAPVWMRVNRSGNTWTMSWSTDGSNYTTGSTFSYALTVSQIGPYAANASDSSGSAPAFTESIDYFFNTASPIVPEDGGVDITPTGVSVSPGAAGATVSWNTADSSNSRVDYGTTSAYGNAVSNPALVTSHSLSISGLTCGTTYHYKVTSAASYAGATASTADATFATTSCAVGGPTISSVVVTPASTSATVSWTTNVAATSQVNYGLTSSYGTMQSNSTLVTSHSLSLTGLSCTTTYHYSITSVDSGGNSSSTTDSTFVTTACPTGGPVSDDFHGSTLNTSLWMFVAPCCGFLRMNGTDALLVVPSMTSHDAWLPGDQTVRLMQPTANVDFEVEVKFDSSVSPMQAYQEEGVIVEQDSNTFLRFDLHSDGNLLNLFSAAISDGAAVSGTVMNVSLPSGTGTAPFWMRLKRAGDTWTQSWSIDGVNFAVGNVITYHMTASRIGPFAGNGNNPGQPAPSFTGAVDYFFNTASRISPADGGMTPPPNRPVINVWYGDNQTFGQKGIAQRWVNILGNMSAPSGIQSASYTLNGGSPQFLRVGPNGYRLVDTGDFNVEIDHANLLPGANTVVITASDNQNHTATHTVTLNWAYTGGTWPLPYSIDWSNVTNIQNVAQIVDGQWALQTDGTVRTMQVGDDRLIALGDVSWTNYQVTAEITVNSFDCFQYSIGVVVGWTGHTIWPFYPVPQPDQPGTGHPFFGFGSYATTGTQTAPNAELNIYANSPNYPETVLVQDTTGFRIVPGVKYVMKFAVQRNSNNTSSEYYLKIWPASATEPSNWDLAAQGDASTGSILLAAFQADVSFGKISVVSLP
jgi:hypothetical protein